MKAGRRCNSELERLSVSVLTFYLFSNVLTIPYFSSVLLLFFVRAFFFSSLIGGEGDVAAHISATHYLFLKEPALFPFSKFLH